MGKSICFVLFFSYSVMRHCWQFRPEDRPSFRELIDWLEAMLQDDTEYLDLTPNAVSNASYLQPITTKGWKLINLKGAFSKKNVYRDSAEVSLLLSVHARRPRLLLLLPPPQPPSRCEGGLPAGAPGTIAAKAATAAATTTAPPSPPPGG